MEDAVTGRGLRVLVSTTTLTDGVNLPIRSIVVASRGVHRDGGFDDFITGAKLLNAIGRAGRAAQETEGVVVIATAEGRERIDLSLFVPTEADGEVRSSLTSTVALQHLAELLLRIRAGTDALYAEAGTVAGEFVSYVWFVAAELERLGQDVANEAVEALLQRTLAWHQLQDVNKAAWLQLARATLAEYATTSPRSRARWSASGASLGTSRALEAMAAEVATRLSDDEPVSVLGGLDIVLADGRLERMLTLPDAPGSRVWNRRGRGRVEVGVDAKALLDDWISGTEIRALADTHLAFVEDETYRLEQTVDVVGAVFDLYLPWVIRTLVAWANEAVTTRRDTAGILLFGPGPYLIPEDAAAIVQRGVNSSSALSLMLGGVLSRRLATAAAAAWEASGAAEHVTLRGWLGAMPVGEWVDRFRPTPSELRDLLTVVRVSSDALSYGLIAGDEVEVLFVPEVLLFDEQPVHLALSVREGRHGVVVRAGNKTIGHLHSRYQQDLEGIVAGGYALEATARVAEGEGRIRCRLIDL